MNFRLLTGTLAIALAIQIVAMIRQSRSAFEKTSSANVTGPERTARSTGSSLDSRATSVRVPPNMNTAEIVADFLDHARQVDDYVGSRPNSAEIARRIKAGEIELRDEVLKISEMRTAYAREEAATALMNALLFLSKTEALRNLIPGDKELASLLTTSCPEERGTWALIAGFSADSAVRSQVIQMAAGDLNEFARSGALWACSTGMADVKEAQETLLRASRDSGLRHQVVAVAGLEATPADGAAAALLDATGDRDPYVRALAESVLARRAAWDDKAALSLGALIQGPISSETAKRIWKALSTANALSRLSPGNRAVLEQVCKENR